MGKVVKSNKNNKIIDDSMYNDLNVQNSDNENLESIAENINLTDKDLFEGIENKGINKINSINNVDDLLTPVSGEDEGIDNQFSELDDIENALNNLSLTNEPKENVEYYEAEDVSPELYDETSSNEAAIYDDAPYADEAIYDNGEYSDEYDDGYENDYASEDGIEDTPLPGELPVQNGNESSGKRVNFKVTKKGIIIFILVLIASVGIGFGLTVLFPGGNSFAKVVAVNGTAKNDNLEVTIEHAIVSDKINKVKAKDGYTYVCVQYSYKNISKKSLTWQDLPFLQLAKYNSDEVKKAPVDVYETSLENKEGLLQYTYLLGMDLSENKAELKSNETRDDADVYLIPKEDLSKYKIYATFDGFDVGLKIEEGKDKLPTLKETIVENRKKIKKLQKSEK